MKIELSVGLPVWNSPDITWVAMESLCRQKNIDFDWELIIAEETDAERFPHFEHYYPRLKAIGCKRISYIPIAKRIALSRKWKVLGRNCSDTSRVFVKHDADCYSEPYRLTETHKLMITEGYDWVQNKVGLFYNLGTGATILYNDPKGVQAPGLNKAMLTESIRQLPDEEKWSCVDGWLHKHCKPQNKYNELGSRCFLGVDTHGLNNISHARSKLFDNPTFPFEATEVRIEQCLDADVVERLKSYLK